MRRPPVSVLGMDANRVSALLSAPMAGLFLVLVLCLTALQQPKPSVVILLPVLRVPSSYERVCPDPNRVIVLRLTQDGKIWISSTEIKPDRLQIILTLVTENRMDRYV